MDVKKLEPVYSVSGNPNGAPAMANNIEIPQKINIGLPYDPAVSLLGIYPKELNLGSQREISTPVFSVAPFTIAKMWKQLQHLSTNEWIEKAW